MLSGYENSGAIMKRLVCVVVFGAALAGCSQEYIDQKNAERDHAFCASVWGGPGQPGYGECRMAKARERSHAGTAAALGALGLGSAIYQNSQPTYVRPTTTTCTQQGVFTNCTNY